MFAKCSKCYSAISDRWIPARNGSKFLVFIAINYQKEFRGVLLILKIPENETCARSVQSVIAQVPIGGFRRAMDLSSQYLL